MIALLGLIFGMALGIVARELWARRSKATSIVRTALLALVLLVGRRFSLNRPPG
jgi:hypothetical protein